MGIDIVRQSVMMALITLLLVAIATAVGTGVPNVESMLATRNLWGLGGYLQELVQSWPLLSAVISYFFLFIAGVLLGRISVRHGLYTVHTHLVMPLYGLTAWAFFSGPNFLLGALCGLLLVIALRGLYACFRRGGYGFGDIFRGSFILGLIPLLYTPAWLLATVVPLAVVIFKRSHRELVVAVVGYLLPVASACYLSWAMGLSFLVPVKLALEVFSGSWSFFPMNIDLAGQIALGTMVVLFVLSVFGYIQDRHASSSKARAILLLNLFLFVIAGTMFFVPGGSGDAGVMIAVPAAMVLPVLFVRLGRGMATLLYIALILVCVFRTFYHFKY